MEKLILNNSPFKFYELQIVTSDLISWKVIVNILIWRKKVIVKLSNIVLDIVEDSNNRAKLPSWMSKEDLNRLYDTAFKEQYPSIYKNAKENKINLQQIADLDSIDSDDLFDEKPFSIINSEKIRVISFNQTNEITVTNNNKDFLNFEVSVADSNSIDIKNKNNTILTEKELDLIKKTIHSFYYQWLLNNKNSLYKVNLWNLIYKKETSIYKLLTSDWQKECRVISIFKENEETIEVSPYYWDSVIDKYPENIEKTIITYLYNNL